MTIDYARLKAWPIADVRQSYAEKDCALYALGLGIGANPTTPDTLRYVYEAGMAAFPSMVLILGDPGPWSEAPGTGITYSRLLHAEQSFELHRPLPTCGTVLGRAHVAEIIDKGPDRGAIVTTRRQLFLNGDPEPLATLVSSSFCRADGGFGGPVTASPKPGPMPDRAPDVIRTVETLPQAALIYRLSGDANPLHVDPQAAAAAGFDRPILHGLCTFGMAIDATMRAFGLAPENVKGASVRFSAPVCPGEPFDVAVWREKDHFAFRASVPGRGVTVLNHGALRLNDGSVGR